MSCPFAAIRTPCPSLEIQPQFFGALRLRLRPQPGRQEALGLELVLPAEQLHDVVGQCREPDVDPLVDEKRAVDLFVSDPVGQFGSREGFEFSDGSPESEGNPEEG